MEPLTSLYFYKYRINLKAKELIHLPPYKGSALRGVFGYTLRRIVCVMKKSQCDDCMLRLKCVYSAIMETPIPEDHPDQRKYKNAPHPYVIIPPLTRRRYFRPDDSIFFDIVLIGKANEYLPYFIYAFTEMGKHGIGKERGKFDVASVEALNLDGTKTEIFKGNTGILKVAGNRIDYNRFISSPSPQPSPIKVEGKSAGETFKGDESRTSSLKCEDEITISFETPVRIKENDRLTQDIPFNLLISTTADFI